MKWLKYFLILVLAAVTVACNGNLKPRTLPVKDQPILTAEQIKAMDAAEVKEAEEAYRQIGKIEAEGLKNQAKVSNVFSEADIRSVLMDISTQTKINIIPDESVQGSVSVTLDNVPLETALKMVLFPGGYKFRYIKEGNYYITGKAIPDNPSFDNLSGIMVIKTNQEATKVAEQIPEYYRPYVFPDKNGNNLTLSGPPDIINRVARDVAMIDKAKRQIEISARFVLVQWETGTNLGMGWGDINLDATGIGSFAKGAVSAFSGNVAASLSNILASNGYKVKVDIVAEPRVVVEDGSEGEIKITREDLFLILSGGGAYYNYFTTKDVETGVIMKVKPSITRDGALRIQLNPEISDIIGEREFKMTGTGSQKLPIIARRSETTTVRIENGKTIAIGGLLMQEKKSRSKGIPGLSSVPLVGSLLFGGIENSQKDIELVIFITPRVIF